MNRTKPTRVQLIRAEIKRLEGELKEAERREKNAEVDLMYERITEFKVRNRLRERGFSTDEINNVVSGKITAYDISMQKAIGIYARGENPL